MRTHHDGLSHAIPIIFLIGIFFSSKKFLNNLKIFFAEQSVASKGNNSNNCVVIFLFEGDVYLTRMHITLTSVISVLSSTKIENLHVCKS